MQSRKNCFALKAFLWKIYLKNSMKYWVLSSSYWRSISVYINHSLPKMNRIKKYIMKIIKEFQTYNFQHTTGIGHFLWAFTRRIISKFFFSWRIKLQSSLSCFFWCSLCHYLSPFLGLKLVKRLKCFFKFQTSNSTVYTFITSLFSKFSNLLTF